MRTYLLLPLLALLPLSSCGEPTSSDVPGLPPSAAPTATAPAPTPEPAPEPAPVVRAGPTLDHSSPQALAASLFAIAKSGDLALLVPLPDPVEADGDTERISNIAKAPPERQAEFREAFGSGTVAGEVQVQGENASVPILFGPDGKRSETLHMVKRDGKWHLQRF